MRIRRTRRPSWSGRRKRKEAKNVRYKTYKTTMGHKVRVRMSDEEIAARWLYRFALVVVPFISSALMFYVWVKVI